MSYFGVSPNRMPGGLNNSEQSSREPIHMKEICDQIVELSGLYSLEGSELLLREMLAKRRDQVAFYDRALKSLGNELSQLLRQNDQLDSDSVHLKHAYKKLEDAITHLTKTRLLQAKNLVRLEEDVFALEDRMHTKRLEITEKEELLRTGYQPSVNSLFLELVRGFGVDFVDCEGIRASVRNRKKNDVICINIDEKMNASDVADRIWASI